MTEPLLPENEISVDFKKSLPPILFQDYFD